MNNGRGTHDQDRDPKQSTDEDIDPKELREAAERAWRDRWGVPGGTPEQRERSADRVGGDGTAQPEPEITDDGVERGGRRPSDDDDDVDPDKKKV